MALGLKSFFKSRNQKINQGKEEYPSLGVVSFSQMMDMVGQNKYIFHGSNVKLEPGQDMLQPSTKEVRGKGLVFVGRFSEALRFAMVRAWGHNQETAIDFFVFASKSYRIVISGGEFGEKWRCTQAPAYIYAVPKEYTSTEFASTKPLPIVARASFTPDVLYENGFQFAVDTSKETTARWWWVRNTDLAIEDYVLPDMSLVFERQR